MGTCCGKQERNEYEVVQVNAPIRSSSSRANTQNSPKILEGKMNFSQSNEASTGTQSKNESVFSSTQTFQEDILRTGKVQSTSQDTRSFDNGAVYEGSVNHQGQQHGQGTYTWLDRSFYKGEWVNGLRHGQGVIAESTGASYEGSWANDKQHGPGVIIYSDGSKYEGSFYNGLPHGRGLYTDADQAEQEFNFVQGTHSSSLKDLGIATEPFMSSKIVKRTNVSGGLQFDDNAYLCYLEEQALRKFATCEEMYFPQQQRVKGYMANGKRNGPGIYIWPDEARYEGNFVDDLMTGQGRIKNGQGEKFVGTWLANKFVLKLGTIDRPLNEQTARLTLGKIFFSMFKKSNRP